MRENNIKFIIDYLKGVYPREFIFGLLGNISVETANTFDPKTVQKGKKDKNGKNYTNDTYMFAVINGDTNFVLDRVGWGLFQLTTSGRKGGFADFIGNMRNMGDFATQLEWFKHEVTLTGFSHVRMAIRDVWNLEDCARIICTEYERPASMQKDEETKEKAIQTRIDRAKAIYEEFKDYYFDGEEQKTTMSKKICLDAGHYGKYNRSPVVPQYYESDFTWNFTNYEKAELEKYGFEVILTRTNKNADLSLSKRGKTAKGCDLFISNHSNACGTESVDRPVGIYPMPYKTTDVNGCKALASRITDNIHIMIGTVQPGKIYSKDAEYDRNKDGIRGDDEYYGVLDGAQSVACPMYMIIEHGFHTNKKTATWLLNDANVKALAIAEAKIIAEYFGAQKEPTIVPTKTIKYVVKKGDTLSKIAKAYGITIDDILSVPQDPVITNPSLINPGQVINIPTEIDAQYHTVNKADKLTSLSKIAKHYGITLAEIKELNPQVKAPLYIIHVGDKIRVK